MLNHLIFPYYLISLKKLLKTSYPTFRIETYFFIYLSVLGFHRLFQISITLFLILAPISLLEFKTHAEYLKWSTFSNVYTPKINSYRGCVSCPITIYLVWDVFMMSPIFFAARSSPRKDSSRIFQLHLFHRHIWEFGRFYSRLCYWFISQNFSSPMLNKRQVSGSPSHTPASYWNYWEYYFFNLTIISSSVIEQQLYKLPWYTYFYHWQVQLVFFYTIICAFKIGSKMIFSTFFKDLAQAGLLICCWPS